MSSKLNRHAYEQMIAEDIEWLLKQPRTLEREHIEAVLRCSPDREYARSEIERRPDGRPFGACLATSVLQSDLYRTLDADARVECDELIERWKGWLKHGK